VVSNSEYLGNIAGSVAFSSTRYAVNPGLAATFPWLSQQATSWQFYRFRKLAFRFVTRVSSATSGSIILSPEYAVSDNATITESVASNAKGAVEDVAWRNLPCHLNPSDMLGQVPRKTVRNGTIAGDMAMYDSANFYVCTVGMVDTSNVGKLWVDYEVEFFVPQSAPTTYLPSQATLVTRAGTQTLATGSSTSLLWDAPTYDPLRFAGQNPAGGFSVFTPPAGAYLITVTFQANDSSAEVFSIQTGMFKNATNMFGVTQNAPAIAGGASLMVTTKYIITFNGTDTFTFKATLTGAAGTLTIPSNSAVLTVELA